MSAIASVLLVIRLLLTMAADSCTSLHLSVCRLCPQKVKSALHGNVNENFQEALSPGDRLCLDESMVKSYHRGLTGKVKILRKPRPVGNEIKDMSDARSNIIIKIELNEGKEKMREKDHVLEYGATTAAVLRLTKDYRGSGRTVIADSWFGSVKSASALMNAGLYSIMLVKTAHKNYPRELLNESELERGEWVAYSGKLDDTDLQAVSFQDLKKKQFISTCSTAIEGNPRKTKHHGEIPRPQVAEEYLKYCSSIDVFNHFRTGALGFEDVVKTHSPHMRQACGILGFIFTNTFLAYRYFKPGQSELTHADFKMNLANNLIKFTMTNASMGTRRDSLEVPDDLVQNSHRPVHLSYPKPCYMCRHGYEQSQRNTTSFQCVFCEQPICKPSSIRPCWSKHLQEGLPQKRRQTRLD